MSVKSLLCIRLYAVVDPTKPQPITATFLPLSELLIKKPLSVLTSKVWQRTIGMPRFLRVDVDSKSCYVNRRNLRENKRFLE